MPIPAYENHGPIDCDVSPDLSKLKGKSVVITGGANGLGEAYVRAFTGAGAYVTFGDINEERGKSIAEELGQNVQFVKCDTTSWTEQLNMFKQAVAKSPAKSCDIVIANAGVSGPDDVYAMEDPSGDPTEPQLRILKINMIAVMYTVKLAMHYFRVQPEAPDRDRCFIFKGSIAGFLDQPGTWQYCGAKFGLRGVMRSARRTSWMEGIRVNYVGPWYTKTTILSQAVIERLESKGVKFSLVEDCAAAMLRLATDKNINGRSLAIVPRDINARGFVDANMDDQKDQMWEHLQNVALAASIRTVVPNAKQ